MLKDNWYLICPAAELEHKIIKRKILGENIILFRSKSNRLVALEDRCCHRNVNLSLGFLKGEHVVCGYHGWEYNHKGRCIHIPSQLSEAKIPRTAQIKSYPIKEFNRWIWLFLGDPDQADKVDPINIPEMNEWDFTYGSYTFKADLESTAESLIDPYHIAFVHRNSIKSFMGQIEDFPANFDIQVREDGLEGIYRRANKGSLAEKIYFGRDPYISTKYRFYYPTISHLELRFKERTLLILEHVMQVDDDHVNMMQITLWKNIFAQFPWFARYYMSKISDKIVREDIDFLTSQLAILKKTESKKHEVSVKGDEISLAFRKFWRKKIKQGAEEENA
jgi:phenylpropionate dioxygenase-like ring-hydroxylating dioxygenase large terminal subunit